MDELSPKPCEEIQMPHSIPRGLLRFLIIKHGSESKILVVEKILGVILRM